MKREQLDENNNGYVDLETLKEQIIADVTKIYKDNGIEIIYYADYDYDFSYEVIKDKNKLLSIILEKK